MANQCLKGQQVTINRYPWFHLVVQTYVFLIFHYECISILKIRHSFHPWLPLLTWGSTCSLYSYSPFTHIIKLLWTFSEDLSHSSQHTRQENEKRGKQIEKEEIKCFYLQTTVNICCIYVENPQIVSRKLLELMSLA